MENLSEKFEKYEGLFIKLKRPAYIVSSQLISDYKSIPEKMNSEEFFKKYGVGNAKIGIDRPLERMEAYELLLDLLVTIDAKINKIIHKGTPYYFLGWLAFQLRDFSKAMFYMDAAVNEDLKFPDIKNKKSTTPALEFFLLSLKLDKKPSGVSDHSNLIEIVKETLQKYNTNDRRDDSNISIITIENFRSKFVENFLYSDPKQRTLLTALYTFLLEYTEKEKQIKLRSDTGGTIQPFINHLFDGARLLESLIEVKGGKRDTLKPKIDSTPKLVVTKEVLLGRKILADARKQYIELSSAKFQDQNFACAYIIRNTTGHSLLWDDHFDKDTYKILYNSLVNSIFWTIDKLWL